MGISAINGELVADAVAQAQAIQGTQQQTATSVGSTTGATSPQYAVVYDLISEGEIHGLVNGAASVYLNGTPLTTEANRPSVSSIVSGNGTFTANSTTVSSNEVNLSGTGGRIILLERGGKTSSAFTANVGDTRIRANGFFTANMAINPALLIAARPKLRITGMGAAGREYVGTVTQYIDANTAVVEPPISTSGVNKAGGIDHIAVVNTATSNSLTVYVAPAVSGTKFQILPPAVAQDQLYNDKWNFKNTAVNFRVGTLNQTPVTFGDVPTASFLTSIEQPLEWTNTFNGLQSPLSYSAAALGVTEASEIDKIRLGIEFPAGLYVNSGASGRIQPAFAGFQVKFQYTQGGEVKTAIIVGPSSGAGFPSGNLRIRDWEAAISGYSGFYKTEVESAFLHEIEIPVEQFKPFTNFSVIVSRINPHSSSDYSTDDATFVSASTLKYVECQVLDKFRYPHSAYAAITFPSEGFNSIPGRSYHVRGIKVQVPSNYTTREESFDGKAKYNGAWDGTFITRYTNNPAWIFYDLATNKRYGLGKYVDPSLVDKYSLYRIGRYCDELVPDGKGGMEPRFTCNVYIFEAEEAYKVLRDLATTFRGMMIWAQGALLAIQDSPKEPIYTFTQGNVVDGLFNYEYSGRLARYNEVNITWNNPDQFYQQDVLTVTDQTDIIKQGKVVPMNSVAFGCTSQGQAYRVALWNMLTSQLETEFISFGTGMNANFLLPGDIVNVQDHHLNAIQASGRIRSASGTTITLDRDVTIASSTFSNRTSFENALVSSGTDNFNSFVGNTGAKAASITRSSTNTASLGSYSYRANSTTGTLAIDAMTEYTAQGYSSAIANTSNNVGLTTSTSKAGIVFSQFSPAISSFGAEISVRTIANTTSEDYNVNGIASYRTYNAQVPLTVNVGYTSGTVKSYNIVANKDKFFGFSSSLSTNIANVSISFTNAVSSTNEFITIDNLILGNTSSAVQSTAHTLHVVFDGPGCYLQQASAVISGTTYYRGDLIPGVTTSVAATNLLDDSGNVVTTTFSEHTHVQKRSITTAEPYVGNIIDISSAFTSTPNTDSIWALENATYDNNVEPKKYRVLSIKEEQGGVYSIVASNYAEQKFDELEAKVQIRDNTFTGPRPGQDIPNVTNLIANYYRMDVNDEDNLSDSILYAYISWTPPVESFTDSNGNTNTREYRYVDAYEIQHNFYDDINTSYRDFLTETVSGNRNNLVLSGISPGTYIVRVRTKNIFGQYSSWYSIEFTFIRPSAGPGYDIFGIKAGGSLDSAVLFEANTFTVIDSQYTYVNPLGKAYTVNGATSAQTSQSFQSLPANDDYFLMWDDSDSTDPWKVIKYYTDTSIRTPYGSGNSYWSEAGIANSGLIQIPGTVSATVGSRTITGTGTYFTSNLGIGSLIKLHNSSNTANSFYAVVSTISSNTSLTTREVIQKSFTNQTIRTPSLKIDLVNDAIFSKIAKNASNVASEEIRYAVTAIDEPQLLILDADSNGFRYTSAGGLIGPSVITLFANRQNLRANTLWYVYDANNNILANTILSNRTDTSAQINATSFGSISNNNFVKVTSNVGSFSSSYTILKIVDGANGTIGRSAHTVLVTNENHSIPLDLNGSNGIYTASGTDILVWEGNTPLTYNVSGTLVPSFNVIVQNSLNITPNTNPTTVTTVVTNDTRRYGNHSNLISNSAYIVYGIGVRDTLGNFITYYIQQSFTGLRAGANGVNGRGAHTVLVVNENHSIPLDSSGLNGIYTASGTDILVWEGNTPLTYNATATPSPSFNVAVASNTNINVNTNPTTNTTAVTNDTRRYGNHSNLTANTGSIVYNITVKDTLGNLTTYTRQQSFTGVRAGAAGANGATGANGAAGEPAISLSISRAGITLFAYAEGTVASYSGASGQASLYRGDVNITENASWTSATTTGLTGTVSNTATTKGQYSVTNLATANDTGTLTINASYAGKTYTGEFSVAKAKGGYEIVGTLPSTNLFEGRVVFLTGEDVLYRYTGSAWTSAVPAANITGQLIEAQLALNSVNTGQIQNTAITEIKIAANAVSETKIAPLSVNTAQIITAAITELKIATSAVTSTKIANTAITEVKLAPLSVNTAQLISNAVTETKIAPLSVNTAQIVGSAITEAKMALNSVNTAAIVGSAITEAKMALNSVNTSAIVGSAITEAKMALNSVNTAALVANAITQVKMAANAVGAAQVQVGAITAPKLNITLGGGNLLNNSGFESAVDLENWTKIISFTGSSSTDRALSGTKSAKFVHTTSGQDSYLYQQYTGSVLPSTTYTFTAWVYVNSITGGAVDNRSVLIYDGTLSNADLTLSSSHATGVWTKKSVTFTTSASPSFIEVRIYAPNGTVYWDNCQVELGDVSTAYSPRPDEILPGTITSTEIANNAITSPKLIAEAVVAGKIAANAVTANTIAANAITTEKLEANSIVAEKLAANSIVTRHLSANSVTTESLAANSVIAENISANSVIAEKIAANSITTIQLAADAVTANKIAANSVIAEKIAANSITTIQLAADAVTANKIAANSVIAEKIAANSITTIQLAANAVLAENIQAGAIETDKLAANSITSVKIASKSITTNKLLVTGSGAALNPDPMGQDIAAWPNGSQLTGITDGPAGNTAIVNPAGIAVEVKNAELIPIEPNKPYRLDMWAKQTAGTLGQGNGYLGIAWYAANGALMPSYLDTANGGANSPSGWGGNGTYSYYGITGGAFPSSWTEYTIGFGPGEAAAIPTAARYVRLVALLNYSSNTGIQHAVTNIRLMEKSDATLITDGAITTSKLAANSVDANKIAANSITTIQLAANAVLAENIQAGAVQTDKLAANSITSVKIAAGSITTNKLYVTGQGQAINEDPGCQDDTAWADGAHGATAIRRTIGDSVSGDSVFTSYGLGPCAIQTVNSYPVSSGKKYRLSAWVRKVGSDNGGLYLRLLDQGGVQLTFSGLEYVTPTASWQKLSTEFTPTASERAVKIRTILNWTGSSSTTNYQEITDIRLEEKTVGDLIVDGTIVGEKIAANSISTIQLAANAVLAENIQAGAIETDKLAANSITSVKIAAGSVTTNKLLVANPAASLLPDSTFEDQASWSNTYGGTLALFKIVTDAPAGRYVAYAASGTAARNMTWYPGEGIKTIPIDRTKSYRLTFYYRTIGTPGYNNYATLQERDSTGALIGGNSGHNFYLWASSASSASWTKVTTTAGPSNFHANTRFVAPSFLLNWENSGGEIQIADVRFEELVTATLIEDGAIITSKLEANAVTANKIAANSITTVQLDVNSVNAEKLIANSIIAGKIAANAVVAYTIAANAVIADKIAANAIETNKINAGAITAAKISTTEAVITGTIQIANGIINNAKILDLSADKLNAGTINVAVVNISGTSTTGLSIKSNTSGERMEISTTSIRIFDTSGTLRVKLGNLT
jgi:predicted phage tail protein